MNLEELREKLKFLFDADNAIGLSMFFILSAENGFSIKKADIDEKVITSLKDQFLKSVRETFIDNAELFFAKLSSPDERKHSAHHYDLADALPDGLRVMKTLLDKEETNLFNFHNDSYSNVFGFVFLLGNAVNKIAIYKKQHPINLIRRDTFMGLYKVGKRLVKMEEDLILISEKFDFMQVGNDVIVVNMNVLEKYFGFDQVIRSKATDNLAIIAASNLVVDIAPLQEMAEDLRFAKKLMRVKADSAVLRLAPAKISSFIKQHPKLKSVMKLNDQSRILFRSRKSKELFLKLLDDDYLKSELTDFLYETETKNRLDNEEATEQ